MENTVIKSLNKVHGKRVVQYFKALGVDTLSFTGCSNEADTDEQIYYGVIDGRFSNHHINYVNETNTKIVQLPRPISDIKTNEVIHCKTLDEAKAICLLFDFSGYMWESGTKYTERNNWNVNGENTCYNVREGVYANKKYYLDRNYIISDASEFLTTTQIKMNRQIKPSQAKSIIDMACNIWKTVLANKWAKDIVLEREISVDESFYKEMRQACTVNQHKVFDEIFGPDIPEFNAGDWVTTAISANAGFWKPNVGETFRITKVDDANYFFNDTDAVEKKRVRAATPEEIIKASQYPKGTPCLVRDFDLEPWKLAYADGNGNFYCFIESGVHKWKYHMELDLSNLPN